MSRRAATRRSWRRSTARVTCATPVQQRVFQEYVYAASHQTERLAGLDATEAEWGRRLIRGFGLLQPLPELDPEAVMAALRLDKKRQETGVPFVLLPRLGETVIKDGVSMGLVAEVLKEIMGGGG